MKAIFAGTFDPFTSGHRDIVERALTAFDGVIVAVAKETGKDDAPLSTRLKIAKQSVNGLANVEVVAFDGLLSDFAAARADCVLVRGIRNSADFEYEKSLTRVYMSQSGIDTVFLCSSASVEHVSSTIVRQLAALGAPLAGYVEPAAEQSIIEAYGRKEVK